MNNSQTFESFVPVYDTVPEKWEEGRQFLVEHLKKISNAVNAREIGFFLDEELISGKQFIPAANLTGNSQQFRTILRKVIDFGALPNAGTKTAAHGITVDANFTLMQMYAAATDPIALSSFPIPYVTNNAVLGNISLQMDATNVSISTIFNWSAYTRCFVVIEYIQEV